MMAQARKNKSKKLNISNDTLAILLVVAIGLSFVNIFTSGFGVTGYAVTDTSTVDVQIETVTAINWTQDDLDFGYGSVDELQTNATVDSEGNVARGNWTAPTDGLNLTNIGGDDVSLTLVSNVTATTLIGGPSAQERFQWKLTAGETDSCSGIYGGGDYLNVNTTAETVCDIFENNDANDTLEVDIKFTIPYDSLYTGSSRSALITATGTAL